MTVTRPTTRPRPHRSHAMLSSTSIERLTRPLVVGAAGLIIAACGGGGTEPPPRETPTLGSVAISPSSAQQIQAGTTTQLTATARDQNGATFSGASISFSSSNESVVTVSSSGLVTSVGPVGVASITATATSGSTTRTSSPVEVRVVAAAASAVAVVSGGSQADKPIRAAADELVARVTDRFGNPVGGASVSWAVTAGGGTVASATTTSGTDGTTRNTLTTGPAEGLNTVTASVAGGAASATFSVATVDLVASRIEKVTDLDANLIAGAAGPIRARVVSASGRPVPGVSVAFAVTAGGGSVDPATATTNASGVAETRWTTGRSAGSNTVTASAPGVGSVTFTVTTLPSVASLSVSPRVPIVDVGSTLTLATVVRDGAGNANSSASVSYASRDAAVAAVSAAGVVSGVKAGQTIIVARSSENESIADSVLVVVAPAGGPVLVTDLGRMDLRTDTAFTTAVVMDMRSSGEKLGSVEVTITWNPAVIGYSSHASGGSGVSPVVNAADVASGRLRLSMADAGGFAGRVELLRVTFRAASTAGQAGPLALSTSEVSASGTFTNLLPKTSAVSHPIRTR